MECSHAFLSSHWSPWDTEWVPHPLGPALDLHPTLKQRVNWKASNLLLRVAGAVSRPTLLMSNGILNSSNGAFNVPDEDVSGSIEVPIYLPTAVWAFEQFPSAKFVMNSSTLTTWFGGVFFSHLMYSATQQFPFLLQSLTKCIVTPEHHLPDCFRANPSATPHYHLRDIESECQIKLESEENCSNKGARKWITWVSRCHHIWCRADWQPSSAHLGSYSALCADAVQFVFSAFFWDSCGEFCPFCLHIWSCTVCQLWSATCPSSFHKWISFLLPGVQICRNPHCCWIQSGRFSHQDPKLTLSIFLVI